MARGFGTTLGVATSDIITSSLTGPTGAFSMHAWIFFRAAGGGSGGRIFDASNNNAGGYHVSNNGPSGYLFTTLFSGSVGQWNTGTTATVSVWEPFGLKYDTGSTVNDPTVYQNNVKKTVGSGLTRTTGPTGTQNAPGLVCVGNRQTAVDRNWDGESAEFAFWNVLLDDAEFAALGAGYSPLLIRPASLLEYVPLVRNIVSARRAVPTNTGTAVQPHPRILSPKPRPQQWLHSVPTFKAAWAMDNNLPVLGTGNY